MLRIADAKGNATLICHAIQRVSTGALRCACVDSVDPCLAATVSTSRSPTRSAKRTSHLSYVRCIHVQLTIKLSGCCLFHVHHSCRDLSVRSSVAFPELLVDVVEIADVVLWSDDGERR